MGTKAPDSDALSPSRTLTEGEVSLDLGYLYNGTTWDRARNNAPFSVLASAVRGSTTNSPDFTNYNARGVTVFFTVSAVPGVQTVTMNIDAKHDQENVYQTFATGPAQVATGWTFIQVYPGISETIAIGNLTTQALALPRVWRVSIVHSGAGNFTYSVGACYQL